MRRVEIESEAMWVEERRRIIKALSLKVQGKNEEAPEILPY